jgi:hypothetical protein
MVDSVVLEKAALLQWVHYVVPLVVVVVVMMVMAMMMVDLVVLDIQLDKTELALQSTRVNVVVLVALELEFAEAELTLQCDLATLAVMKECPFAKKLKEKR